MVSSNRWKIGLASKSDLVILNEFSILHKSWYLSMIVVSGRLVLVRYPLMPSSFSALVTRSWFKEIFWPSALTNLNLLVTLEGVATTLSALATCFNLSDLSLAALFDEYWQINFWF